MCVGGQKQPKAPKPVPIIPAPAPPPQPQQITPQPQLLEPKVAKKSGLKMRRSRGEASGAVSRGTNQLRVPLNIGTSKSGGLNI